MDLKKTLLFAFCFCCLKVSSQDFPKIFHIDSLIMVINKSNYKTQFDSTIQDHASLGLYMKSYVTMVTDGNSLKKYVNYVKTVRQEDGITKQLTSSNTFYYDQNKLIKVEEFETEDGKEHYADWYYLDEKPLYYTFVSSESEQHANMLLIMSKVMQKQIFK